MSNYYSKCLLSNNRTHWEFKLKAIGEVKNGKKKMVICSEYKMAPSTLATFLRNEKQIVSAKESQKFHEYAKAKKMRRATHDSQDVAVFLWIKQARAIGTISGALIVAKADSLAEKLNIRDFNANYW